MEKRSRSCQINFLSFDVRPVRIVVVTVVVGLVVPGVLRSVFSEASGRGVSGGVVVLR